MAATEGSFDHLLLIGFGGPTKPEEVRPFLEIVTRGAKIPEQRLREVEHHYHQTGGFSPYNSHAARLSEKLSGKLAAAGATVPAFLGMRNWNPFLADTLREIKGRGLSRGLGVVLAPHRCEASFERYVRAVEQAKAEAGAQEVQTEYLAPWYDHPLFAQAQAGRVREVWGGDGDGGGPDWASTVLLFTAHSVPVEMARASRYEREVLISGARVAAELGGYQWSVAYQSRSGPPAQPWLGPDPAAVLRDLARAGKRRVVAVPIGFLFDHTEVLYDLDIEARQAAEAAGLEFTRAPTVMDHPKFVGMLAALVQQQTRAEGARQ